MKVMCLVWVSLIFFIPESPVHYISRRQYAEAREALEWLRGTNEVRTFAVQYSNKMSMNCSRLSWSMKRLLEVWRRVQEPLPVFSRFSSKVSKR